MKKIILLSALLLSFTNYSQTAPIGGKILNVEEKYSGEFFENISDDGLSPAVLKALNDRVPKKLSKYGFDDIKIENIGKPENMTTAKFQVNLKDNKTGEYYKIRLNMSYNPLYIIKEPKGGYCNLIIEEKDKFEDKITFRTPILDIISFGRIKTKESIKTYMSIHIDGNTANVNEKGAFILFENGTKIIKPEAKINVNVNSDRQGFIYSTIISLDDKEIDLLSKNIMTDLRLFIYDVEVKDGKKYQELIKCINDK